MRGYWSAPALQNISQVAKRAQEKMLLDKALLCSSMATNFTPQKRTALIVHTLPSKPSFVLRYTSTTRTCTAIWLGSNKSVEVHPMITTTFGWKWGDIIGRDITALPCYTEYCSPDGTRYRAHPNYNNEGPWYDWGLIRFEQPNRTECTDLFPCRILFFYVTPEEGDALGIATSMWWWRQVPTETSLGMTNGGRSFCMIQVSAAVGN